MESRAVVSWGRDWLQRACLGMIEMICYLNYSSTYIWQYAFVKMHAFYFMQILCTKDSFKSYLVELSEKREKIKWVLV